MVAKTVDIINLNIAGELIAEASVVAPAAHLYLGVDIAKNAHVAACISQELIARYGRFEKCPVLTFANSREGFEKLATQIREYGSPEACSVLVESTGHYGAALSQYLREIGCQIYVMHVMARPQSHDKSDRRDALALANSLYLHLAKGVRIDDKARRIVRKLPPTETAMQLQGLVHRRQEITSDTTRRKNKLTAIVDEMFPELTKVYADPNTPSALALRQKYPTPQSIIEASIDDLCATRLHRRPGRASLAQLQALAAQTIGTKSEHRLASLVVEQEQLIAELTLLNKHVERLEERIAPIVEGSREGQILLSFPAVGMHQAALLIGSIGNIRNFDSIAKLRSYCGWSPQEEQTGITLDRSHLVQGGSPLLKTSIYMTTLQAIRMDTPWKVLYDRLVPRMCPYDERLGKYRGKMKVVGRVAGQMVGLIWRFLYEDAFILDNLAPGQEPPEPKLYDATIHLKHLTHV